MANSLAAVVPQILAQGLLALRENAVMPALVNSDYGADAAAKGATIDVPIPSLIAVQDVTPAATPPSTADSAPTSVPITLDKWKEAPFYLTDKDLKESIAGIIPMQASEAVKAVVNQVHVDIFATFLGVYGYVGTAGTTPFASDTSDATGVRKVLSNQLAPLTDRRVVFDADAEANAGNLRAFQDVNFGVTADNIREGTIARKFGFDWAMSQLVPTHTNTGTGTVTLNDASKLVGETQLIWDGGGTEPGNGDIFTVAGDTQTYVVTAHTTTTIDHEPGAKVAWADSAALTFKATHIVNLAFHRDAIAFASRPLEDDAMAGLGSLIQSAVDPISGLTLRLEVKREHKRIRWSFDVLYGTALVRRELACRLAG